MSDNLSIKKQKDAQTKEQRDAKRKKALAALTGKKSNASAVANKMTQRRQYLDSIE